MPYSRREVEWRSFLAWRRVQVMGVTLLLLDDGMMMLALCVCVGEEVRPVLFLIHPPSSCRT